MENKPRFYLPELDGLRFIAFLLVFIHNAPSISSSKLWTALHDYGWIGVDLFFCLSGYLITKLLVSEYEQTGEIRTRNFYIRRMLRILPLYFFYITLIFIFPGLFQRNYIYSEFLQIAGLLTFTFNFVYIYLFPFAISFFLHLWTISFEEQFYIFIPWLVQGIQKIKPKSRIATLAIFFLFGSVIRALFIYTQTEHPAIYVLPFTRFESILGGIAIGLGLFNHSFLKIKTWALLLLGLILITFVFFLPNVNETNWSLVPSYLFLGTGLSLLLLAVIRQNNQVIKNLLSNQLLVFLGKISYGLYIFHLIGIQMAFQILNAALNMKNNLEGLNFLVFITGLIITISLAMLSYRLIEKPFLMLKKRYAIINSRPI